MTILILILIFTAVKILFIVTMIMNMKLTESLVVKLESLSVAASVCCSVSVGAEYLSTPK